MFGYVRPVRDRLTEEQYERFRAVYCGLCHRLKSRCGFAARFTVNYDFAFLAMLLAEPGEGETACLRCVAHPFKKRRCRCGSPGLDAAAELSVILSFHKLRDTVRDEGFFRSLRAGTEALLLRRAYKKASASRPGFSKLCARYISELSALEAENCPSPDRAADKFALILAACAESAAEPGRRRILGHLLYHVGRLIYLLDALDDLEKDLAEGCYNPLVPRYGLTSAELPEEAAEALERTLRHSINIIASDFQLLQKSDCSDLLENIIYLGLPAVASAVIRKRIPKTDGDTE